MKKKGFTLVELLAVIAILAILVIVAMPNVLGMFNQSKANTFVTEVQEYMNVATTSFMQDALSTQGKTLYFGNGKEVNASGTEVANGHKFSKLDMSGTEKSYFVEMDRNGNFKRVIIFDANYCYDSKYTNTSSDTDRQTAKDKFEKTDIVVSDVVEIDAADTVNYVITKDASGKITNVTVSQSAVGAGRLL